MRIKQLQLAGFKSFPARTVLDFPRGVTGVVGPNGCGKSNVVDAIRWVLGEQSAKHLRGDAMEAVVFNGNERLAPLGMAEVSLTFENDGSRPALTDLDLEVSTIPAHVRELPEIMITRRYYRSGESEYFINRTSCRLKDITELFLGTGVGTKAYGIIEQGRVDQLVNAKPEERRLFIEEAAGTTLYRSRKLAAERKMERTRENLARVSDILAEIGRQVQYLERQAKKAEEYKRLQEEIRRLELHLASRQWHRLQAEQHERESALQQLAGTEAELRQNLAACEIATREAGEAVGTAEHRQAQLRERLAVLDAERESAKERSHLLTHERDERERRRVRLMAELEAVHGAGRELATALETAGREQAEWANGLRLDEDELSEREAELVQARAAAGAAQLSLDTAKSALAEHLTREVEVRNALAVAERRREQAGRQLDKCRGEQDILDQRLREITEQAELQQRDVAALRGQLAAATGEKETRAQHIGTLSEARRRCDRELVDSEAALLQARSRLESLEQIQLNYEGYQRGVRAIMRAESHPDGVVGVVAEVINTPEEYERAVAAVLGDRLQYVIVRTEEAAAGAVHLLRREAGGRGSFIPLQPRAVKLNGAVSLNGSTKRLLDFVRVEPPFHDVAESLLGEVVLVPDLDAALSLWRQNGVHVTLVTPQGDVIDPSGVVTGGSDRPLEEEILSRKREIEALRLSAATAAAQLDALRGALERVDTEMSETAAALKALDDGMHALIVQIVAREKDVERLELERPQCISRRDVIRYEIESLRAEEEAATAEVEVQRGRLAELVARHQSFDQEVAAHRDAVDAATVRTEQLNASVTAVKVRVAERRQRQLASVAAAESLRRQQSECTARSTALRGDIGDAEREREELAAAIRTLETEGAERTERCMRLGDEAESAAGNVERLTALWRAEEQRVRDTQATLDAVRGERSQVELARSEIRLRIEHLVQAMHEKHGIDVAGHASDDPVDETAATERLETLRQRLGRLGEVNVGAIEELREFGERSATLRSQRDDLEQALGHLERTIQKLNRASRTRFAETFARANEIFQQVFPRLFRGGEAHLVLTNEHDLLETGVDIVVRPPGKRLDSVALLSGGERALVAVSLIFSLFLINPTPFCILDEVDAPLDDANVGRFNQMVREMSGRSQFILITHNKRTMESADVLYGITMQEPGISKVISVAMS